MDIEKIEGSIVGVIALFFLLFPVFYCLRNVLFPPPPSYYEYMPGVAGPLTLLFFLGSNILGIIFEILTKSLLKRSTVFGAIFIVSGVLNLCVLNRMGFRVSYGWGEGTPLFYTPSIVTSLVGVSLIVSFKRLVFRQNIE